MENPAAIFCAILRKYLTRQKTLRENCDISGNCHD